MSPDPSIIHLSDSNPPNADLLREADSYDVVPTNVLDYIFIPLPVDPELPMDLSSIAAPDESAGEQEPQSEKPDAAPSDLNSVADPSIEQG